MAKRKAARTTGRTRVGKRAGARPARSAARKTAPRTRAARKTAKKGSGATARQATRTRLGRKSAARKATARRAPARKALRRKATARQAPTHMKVRPLHDRIIVRRLEEGEQKVGGIIIPDSAKEKPQQGKVFAVGAGKVKDDGKRQALDVKNGDTILFGKYSGQEIKIDGEEYLIMREDEVLAILDSKGK